MLFFQSMFCSNELKRIKIFNSFQSIFVCWVLLRRSSLQIAGVSRGRARIQLRETERGEPADHSGGAGSAPLAGVPNDVRSEWHLFRRREEPREDPDRPERLRQEHLSQASRADRVHGSHRLLRAGQIGHHRNNDSHPDSDHVRGQHRSKYEHVSARYAAGKAGTRRETQSRKFSQRSRSCAI